jgi:hypothetical protein
MREEIRGGVDESFRETLYRAFRQAAISEMELARRLGLPSQPAAHGRLRRTDSITERSLRETARALGYRVQLTLVPLPDEELPRLPAKQLTLPLDAPPKKPKRRRKDAPE